MESKKKYFFFNDYLTRFKQYLCGEKLFLSALLLKLATLCRILLIVLLRAFILSSLFLAQINLSQTQIKLMYRAKVVSNQRLTQGTSRVFGK